MSKVNENQVREQMAKMGWTTERVARTLVVTVGEVMLWFQGNGSEKVSSRAARLLEREKNLHPVVKSARYLRGCAEWSRSEMAEAVGVSEATIAKMEKGSSDPSLATVDAMHKVFEKKFGTPIGAFMTYQVERLIDEDK